MASQASAPTNRCIQNQHPTRRPHGPRRIHARLRASERGPSAVTYGHLHGGLHGNWLATDGQVKQNWGTPPNGGFAFSVPLQAAKKGISSKKNKRRTLINKICFTPSMPPKILARLCLRVQSTCKPRRMVFFVFVFCFFIVA